jgi:hypothetical protein
MKPSTFVTFSIFIIAICFSTCGKKVENANPAYIGYWWASMADKEYVLVINDESEATYTITSSLLDETKYTGKARISGEKLKIGRKSFHIDQEPQTSPCGACTLIIDGVTLQK